MEKPRLTVVYNARCPICSREIDHYTAMAKRIDAPLDFVDLHDGGAALAGVDADTATRRLHAVSGGEVLEGVDAFAALWDRIPRYRPLARLSRSRLGRPVADFLYNRVAAPLLYRLHLWRQGRATRPPVTGARQPVVPGAESGNPSSDRTAR